MENLYLVTIVLVSRADTVCIDTSSLIQNDVYLENSLYGVTTARTILDCAADCFSISDSLSFGFEPATGSCHLHGQNSAATNVEKTEKKNWLHGDTDSWPKTLLGPCDNRTCKRGDRCILHRITMAPVCVKAEVFLPPGYCPVPVIIPNANISEGGQQTGSERIYTCNHGYLDISLDSTTGLTTCMADGKWSKMQLNCSGPYIRMETSSNPEYIFTPIPQEIFQVITGNKSILVFLARTCRDLNFKLSGPTIPDGQFCEVVIGGWHNTRSVLRMWATPTMCILETEHRENGTVSCEEFRPFWISWRSGTISVGKGHIPGDEMFMKLTSAALTSIGNASISSHKNNQGIWLFVSQM